MCVHLAAQRPRCKGWEKVGIREVDFRNPQAISSALAMLGMLQCQDFMFLNHLALGI